MALFDEPIWNEWFDSQYELNERIARAVRGLSEGRDRAFAAALWASVIEAAAERLRSNLDPKEA